VFVSIIISVETLFFVSVMEGFDRSAAARFPLYIILSEPVTPLLINLGPSQIPVSVSMIPGLEKILLFGSCPVFWSAELFDNTASREQNKELFLEQTMELNNKNPNIKNVPARSIKRIFVVFFADENVAKRFFTVDSMGRIYKCYTKDRW